MDESDAKTSSVNRTQARPNPSLELVGGFTVSLAPQRVQDRCSICITLMWVKSDAVQPLTQDRSRRNVGRLLVDLTLMLLVKDIQP